MLGAPKVVGIDVNPKFYAAAHNAQSSGCQPADAAKKERPFVF
jgi:hypothetical protein